MITPGENGSSSRATPSRVASSGIDEGQKVDGPPGSGDAIEHRREDLPAVAQDLHRVALRGGRRLAAFTVQKTVGDLGRIAVVVAIVDLVLMMLFLRALVAPFYLLAASTLALAAALGITMYLFQRVLGGEDLTYYVPFVASVLLISPGSGYSIFLVGRIWQERRARPQDQ